MRNCRQPPRIVLFANTEWYLFNFRLPLAEALRTLGLDVLLVSPPGPYGERLAARGFRWLPAPMDRRSLNPFRELWLLLWLVRLLRRERVALVHGFTIKCAVYGSLAARLARVPARINAVAGLGYVFISGELRARLLRPLVRLLLKLALGGPDSRLVLQNEDDLALFLRTGLVDPDRVRLIAGSGVDCQRFVHSPRRSRQPVFTVLLAARLLWDKGLAEFVEAARRLKGQGRAIRFLLAGEPDTGNPASVDVSILHDWVATGVIEWLGHVSDMPDLLARVDAVALPSYREGLPRSLIEAAACGLPLVTTDVPGCRAVVTHDMEGLLVPLKDSDALAAAIARLQDDPQLCRRLGQAARIKALTQFDQSIVIGQTLDVYRELIGASGFLLNGPGY